MSTKDVFERGVEEQCNRCLGDARGLWEGVEETPKIVEFGGFSLEKAGVAVSSLLGFLCPDHGNSGVVPFWYQTFCLLLTIRL